MTPERLLLYPLGRVDFSSEPIDDDGLEGLFGEGSRLDHIGRRGLEGRRQRTRLVLVVTAQQLPHRDDTVERGTRLVNVGEQLIERWPALRLVEQQPVTLACATASAVNFSALAEELAPRVDGLVGATPRAAVHIAVGGGTPALAMASVVAGVRTAAIHGRRAELHDIFERRTRAGSRTRALTCTPLRRAAAVSTFRTPILELGRRLADRRRYRELTTLLDATAELEETEELRLAAARADAAAKLEARELLGLDADFVAERWPEPTAALSDATQLLHDGSLRSLAARLAAATARMSPPAEQARLFSLIWDEANEDAIARLRDSDSALQCVDAARRLRNAAEHVGGGDGAAEEFQRAGRRAAQHICGTELAPDQDGWQTVFKAIAGDGWDAARDAAQTALTVIPARPTEELPRVPVMLLTVGDKLPEVTDRVLRALAQPSSPARVHLLTTDHTASHATVLCERIVRQHPEVECRIEQLDTAIDDDGLGLEVQERCDAAVADASAITVVDLVGAKRIRVHVMFAALAHLSRRENAEVHVIAHDGDMTMRDLATSWGASAARQAILRAAQRLRDPAICADTIDGTDSERLAVFELARRLAETRLPNNARQRARAFAALSIEPFSGSHEAWAALHLSNTRAFLTAGMPGTGLAAARELHKAVERLRIAVLRPAGEDVAALLASLSGTSPAPLDAWKRAHDKGQARRPCGRAYRVGDGLDQAALAAFRCYGIAEARGRCATCVLRSGPAAHQDAFEWDRRVWNGVARDLRNQVHDLVGRADTIGPLAQSLRDRLGSPLDDVETWITFAARYGVDAPVVRQVLETDPLDACLTWIADHAT